MNGLLFDLKKYEHRVKVKFVKILTNTVRRFSAIEKEFQSVWTEIDSIDGFLVSPLQERWLFMTAKKLPQNANLVEIGSFKGRSTAALAYGCRNTRKQIYAIDTFNGNDTDFKYRNFFHEFKNNLQTRSLFEYVTPIQARSDDVGRNWNKPIHFLFIDGSHEYKDVVQDFNLFFPHVVSGGFVALHDVVPTWPGVVRAWTENVKHQLVNIGAEKSLAYGQKP